MSVSKKITAVIFVVWIGFCAVFCAAQSFASQLGSDVSIAHKIYYSLSDTLKASDSGDGVPARNGFITFYGLLQRIAFKNVVDDSVAARRTYRMTDGSLTFILGDEDLSAYSENLIALKKRLDAQGIDLLFVAAPYKVDEKNPLLPRGVKDYSNKRLNSLLEAARAGGVDCIDLREEMRLDGLRQSDYFFITDHHWTTQAAFWAFGNIAEKLENDYGFEVDPKYTDIENYNVETFKEVYLGSEGERTGPLYAGVDDFTLITPKFETDFDFTDVIASTTTRGAFEDVLVDRAQITAGDIYSRNSYLAYTANNDVIIKNRQNTDGSRVLMVRDSFSRLFTPFMSLISGEVNCIDLRRDKELSLTAI